MVGVLVTIAIGYADHPSITSQYINFQSMKAVNDFAEALDKVYADKHDYNVRVTVFGGVV